jgi:hypothetical protein
MISIGCLALNPTEGRVPTFCLTWFRKARPIRAHIADDLVSIGPYPREEARYRQRSPLYHADRVAKPGIFFQGDEDAVVPPNQAEVIRRGAPAVRGFGSMKQRRIARRRDQLYPARRAKDLRPISRCTRNCPRRRRQRSAMQMR